MAETDVDEDLQFVAQVLSHSTQSTAPYRRAGLTALSQLRTAAEVVTRPYCS